VSIAPVRLGAATQEPFPPFGNYYGAKFNTVSYIDEIVWIQKTLHIYENWTNTYHVSRDEKEYYILVHEVKVPSAAFML
jgi:hypothetical protein